MALKSHLIEQIVFVSVALVAKVQSGAVHACFQNAGLAELRSHVQEKVVGFVASIAVPQRVAVHAFVEHALSAGCEDSNCGVIGVKEVVGSFVAAKADCGVLGTVEAGGQAGCAVDAAVTHRIVAPCTLKTLINVHTIAAQFAIRVQVSASLAKARTHVEVEAGLAVARSIDELPVIYVVALGTDGAIRGAVLATV